MHPRHNSQPYKYLFFHFCMLFQMIESNQTYHYIDILNSSFFFFIIKISRKSVVLWRKCTFSPYILAFFHFRLYILILPLLVPKLINSCYFLPFRQSTDGNS